MIQNQIIRELVEKAGVNSVDIFTFGHIPFEEDQLIKFTNLVIEQYLADVKEDRRSVQRELGYSRIGLKNV